jgi:hypothetical protein
MRVAGGAVRWMVLAVVVVAAGCGPQARDTTPRQPHLPRALAESLAQQADAVATALASNDGCSAQARIAALQQSVESAVNEHQVPRRFVLQLTRGVDDLAGRITCTPPPAPPADEHGKKHHDHGKNQNEGGD